VPVVLLLLLLLLWVSVVVLRVLLLLLQHLLLCCCRPGRKVVHECVNEVPHAPLDPVSLLAHKRLAFLVELALHVMGLLKVTAGSLQGFVEHLTNSSSGAMGGPHYFTPLYYVTIMVWTCFLGPNTAPGSLKIDFKRPKETISHHDCAHCSLGIEEVQDRLLLLTQPTLPQSKTPPLTPPRTHTHTQGGACKRHAEVLMTASSKYLRAIVVEGQVQFNAQGLLQFELLQAHQLAPVFIPT
jgi:hypothetical protein